MSNYGVPVPPMQLDAWDDRLKSLDFDAFQLPGYGSDLPSDMVGPGRWATLTSGEDDDYIGIVWTNDNDVTSVLYERRPDFDPIGYDSVVVNLKKMFRDGVSASEAFDRCTYAYDVRQALSGDLTDLYVETADYA